MVHIFISVAFSQASKMMTLLTITTFVLLGNVITFSKAFLTLCAIQALRSPLCIFVPRGISLAAKLATTVENLQKLLLLNECLGVRYLREHRLITDPNNKIVLVDVCTKWHAENSKHTLSQINLSLLQGEILMVIGQSGAGKTTLLHLLMGELIHTSGVLTVTGKAVYCPQIPWLIPDTIRNNITCGKQYEEDRFQIILNVCDLKAEIHDLPEKDLTLIGDEGNIVLSSMFLAKLTLARTVYQDADIYLLDEPFAYLDQYTFMTIFSKCIWNFLKYKTVILVTDEASILQYADQILILHEGKMEGCGPYGDLISAGIEIHKYVDYDKHTDSEKDLGHCTFKQKFAHQESVIMTTNYCRRASSDNNLEMDQNVSSFKIEVIDTLGDGLTVSGSKALLTFMKAGGKVWWLVAVAVIFLFFQVLSCTWDYGFLVWTMNGTDIILEVWFAALDENHHVYLFVLWIVEMVLLVLSLIAFLCMHRVYTTASSNIHNNLVSSILQASLQCLDNSCLNKVVGTLRQDMKLLDENLPPTFMELTQYSMIILGCIITIGLANYWLFISMTIILFCCFMVGSYSLRSIRNIKKSELSKLKLVDVYFAYSMEGLSAIRAYEAEVYFRQKFVEYQDQHSSALLLLESTIQALGMWLGIFTILNIVSVITSFLLFKREFEPSFLSLALYCSLVISELAPETITYCALAAKQLGSISTILELSSLEKEIVGATAEKSNEDIPDDWPINGEIRVEDLSVRYSDDKPDVLRNVSFKILGGEKIGAVGCTGAGKSALVVALLRMVKLSPETKIWIDNINTSNISLARLRSCISVVPRYPLIFSGTLRFNLDPHDMYPDNVLWESLEKVGLRTMVQSLDKGLLMHHVFWDQVFNTHQRQLICLARAIIKQNSILLLDVAMVDLDLQSELAMLNIIRTCFSSATVIIISHRLRSVMKTDRVIVLEAGELAEFGHPYMLLQNEDSILHKMIHQTGAVVKEQLVSLAKEAFAEYTKAPVVRRQKKNPHDRQATSIEAINDKCL